MIRDTYWTPGSAMTKGRTDDILGLLAALRRNLHRHAELSGQEVDTQALIREFILRHAPAAETVTDLGGTGLAFCYPGRLEGPTVMFRAELDALPIHEATPMQHRSLKPGVSHKCGHDGHMSILAGLGMLLHRQPPRRGRVVLLFQPAEETGEGASRIIHDPKFEGLSPDLVFALHNIPGHRAGKILVKSGAFTCASVGMRVRLSGRSAHASHPEQGLSPAAAMCDIMRLLPTLPAATETEGFSLVTLVHVCLGEEAFGTAPGNARILATLRAEKNEDLERLKDRASKQRVVAPGRIISSGPSIGRNILRPGSTIPPPFKPFPWPRLRAAWKSSGSRSRFVGRKTSDNSVRKPRGPCLRWAPARRPRRCTVRTTISPKR